MMIRVYTPKYKTREVAMATGLSEGAAAGYAHSRQIEQDGWTINDIVRFIAARRRKTRATDVDMRKVEEIRTALKVMGWVDDYATEDDE